MATPAQFNAAVGRSKKSTSQTNASAGLQQQNKAGQGYANLRERRGDENPAHALAQEPKRREGKQGLQVR